MFDNAQRYLSLWSVDSQFIYVYIHCFIMKSYCDLPHSLLSNLVRNIANFFFFSWNLLISMPAGEPVETPYCLKPTEDYSLDEVVIIDIL